jgi:hypothetical protein
VVCAATVGCLRREGISLRFIYLFSLSRARGLMARRNFPPKPNRGQRSVAHDPKMTACQLTWPVSWSGPDPSRLIDLALERSCRGLDIAMRATPTHRSHAGYRPADKAARDHTPHGIALASRRAHRTTVRPRLPICWRIGGAGFPQRLWSAERQLNPNPIQLSEVLVDTAALLRLRN